MSDISYLHRDFIDFAAGMPAIAISWRQIKRDVKYLEGELAGTNPDRPAPSLANIPMPVFDLAFSVFVEHLEVKQSGSHAVLDVKFRANVHLLGLPTEVIYSYVIETPNPVTLVLDYNRPGNEVFWRQQGSVIPRINGQFGPNADAVLAKSKIPEPRRDTYLSDVDRNIKWLTGSNFINLVTNVLIRYSLGELAWWFRFAEPIRFSVTSSHILITASRATLTIGDCNPESIEIEADPDFPYKETIPAPKIVSDHIDFAVYAPRTRLFQFFAKKIEPAVNVADNGGGVIKWSIDGSIGLKSLILDILTTQGLSGVLFVRAQVDFVAAARAWIDGPSGSRLSLASASVLGKGNFEAEIALQVVPKGAYVEAILRVTRADIPPGGVDWEVHTKLGWPLDQVASIILDYISKNEIRKLEGSVTRLGKWSVLGMPYKYLETLPNGYTPDTSVQGLHKVSSMFCLHGRKED
jgi:hypothetical protein